MLRTILTNCETVNFNHENSIESIFGKAYVESFSSNAFVLKFSKDTIMTENSKWEVNVMVYGDTIIGKGSRVYKYAILQAIAEFKAGEHDGRN